MNAKFTQISNPVCAALLASAISHAAAQTASVGTSRWAGWDVVAMDDCSTSRELPGSASQQRRRITEVAGGLNYLSNGQWAEAKELIALAPDGTAAATNCQLKVYFPAYLASGVKLVTPSNPVFQTRPASVEFVDQAGGIVSLDTLSGEAVAEIQPPNRIIDRGAFSSTNLIADVQFTCARIGLECDVILRRRPRAPEAFALSPAQTQLRVTHQWADVSQPTITPSVLGPGLVDSDIDLGDLWFPTGSAFGWDGGGSPRSTNSPAAMNPMWAPGNPARVPATAGRAGAPNATRRG